MNFAPEPKGRFNLSALAVRERAVTLFFIAIIVFIVFLVLAITAGSLVL